MEETIRPSGLEAINVKEGRAHLFSVLWCGSPDPDFSIPDPGFKKRGTGSGSATKTYSILLSAGKYDRGCLLRIPDLGWDFFSHPGSLIQG
jgi:hypothetical protein